MYHGGRKETEMKTTAPQNDIITPRTKNQEWSWAWIKENEKTRAVVDRDRDNWIDQPIANSERESE